MDELLDDLQSKIKDGTYPPGSQLPSGRVLADSYDVSHSTIQRAVATLREQGVLVGRPGRGVFVADNAPRSPRGNR
ncbi:winged helix-turn-helix domain-containing protein [Micromonospora echinofusca]|uniref:winged helix-turn-helix domain-containing protein n=1 Tax=Micromonospora echinofusca TaxID=47858 RepID=UPI0033C09683